MKDGILLIDKEAGVTSRFVDNKVQHLFQTRKVGHLGTLDPFATGLLVLALGKGTKFLPYLGDEEKEYEVRLRLFERTSTGDLDGEVLERREGEFPEESHIKEMAVRMLGEREQLPPMASAVKVGGKPLYERFRKGEEVERKPRKIKVFSFDILGIDKDLREISFRTKVSRGTYVRVLGEEFASLLGTIGHLVALRRLSIGAIPLEKARLLSEIREEDVLDPMPFLSLPKAEIEDEEDFRFVMNGAGITLMREEERLLLVKEGKALAVYRKALPHYYVSERGLF